jgi:transposase
VRCADSFSWGAGGSADDGGIRSERRLCDEVHLNLAYRWFCRLGLDGDVPDHSTFSKNRHGRFRESDLLRKLFETIFRSGLRAKSGVH